MAGPLYTGKIQVSIIYSVFVHLSHFLISRFYIIPHSRDEVVASHFCISTHMASGLSCWMNLMNIIEDCIAKKSSDCFTTPAFCVHPLHLLPWGGKFFSAPCIIDSDSTWLCVKIVGQMFDQTMFTTHLKIIADCTNQTIISFFPHMSIIYNWSFSPQTLTNHAIKCRIILVKLIEINKLKLE